MTRSCRHVTGMGDERVNQSLRPLGNVGEFCKGVTMMENVWGWARNVLAVLGVLGLGYWLGASVAVKASSGGDTQFQLSDVGQGSALLVYEPSVKTVYVYRAATSGNSTVQCSFKFALDKPGGPIQRTNCPIGSAF